MKRKLKYIIPLTLIILTIIGGINMGWFDGLLQIGNKGDGFFSKQKTATIKKRLDKTFKAKKIQSTLTQLHVLVFKADQQLEIWGTDEKGKKQHLKTTTIPIHETPRNDIMGTIPIGFYSIETLTPNPDLSIVVKTPNEFYRQKQEKSTVTTSYFYFSKNPPSISNLSIDILTLEETIYLANKLPKEQTEIIIFPNDIRNKVAFEPCHHCSSSIYQLYGGLGGYLELFGK